MAINPILLRRYCGALLDAAEEARQVEKVEQALERIAGAASAEPRFTALLGSPRLSAQQKVELIEAAVGGGAPALVKNFARLLVEHGRISLVPEAAKEFHRLAAERSGTTTVGVQSFEALPPESIESLRARLSSLLESQVALEIETSPALLGGVRLRIGDRVVDGSLSGRLEEIRKRMIEGNTN